MVSQKSKKFPMTKANKRKFNELLFGVRRSILYHHLRRLFFDRLHKTSTILSALSGSATIISVLAKFGPEWTTAFALIVAVSSVSDLVFGPFQAARLHEDLAKSFVDLEMAMVTSQDLSDEVLDDFTAQRLDIEKDEPPPRIVLNSICHNELLRAMGYDESKFVKISWYQRWAAQFVDINEHKIKPKKAA
jgi:hypothetical protein